MAANTLTLALSVVVALGGGAIVSWWLSQRWGLDIQHGQRLIEEHTKRFHEYVETYYLKLIGTSLALAQSLKKLSNDPRLPDAKSSFFLLSRLTKLQEDWSKKKGGIVLLRNRTGEGLVVELDEQMSGLLFGEEGFLSHQDDSLLRSQIDVDEQFHVFLTKLEKEPLKGIYERYAHKIEDSFPKVEILAAILKCWATVMDFEINRIYAPWYEHRKQPSPPTLNQKEWQTITGALKKCEPGRKAQTEYLDRLKGVSWFTKVWRWPTT